MEATGTKKLNLGDSERETLPLVAIRLRSADLRLLVAVWDTSWELPRMQAPKTDAEHGRCPPLVTLASERWDSRHHPRVGWRPVASSR